MNKEALQKFRLAQQYQKEALLELVPKDIRENLETIENELSQIAKTCVEKLGRELIPLFTCTPDTSTVEGGATHKAKKTTKIDID